ncbi:MAG: hypothetical protein HYT94_01990 [Parcubacteria group bacterium]|nr:hypothetical protein [Parcubacteria group bacterium]
MKLVNTVTGEEFPFTFEAVGACDVETLAFAISEIKKNGLLGKVRRLVTIRGLNDLMENGLIRPMLQMAHDAGIRLIPPPVSPLMEIYENGTLELRRNFDPEQGPWIGTTWNNATLRECDRVLQEFRREYKNEFSLRDDFGVLVTDLGLLSGEALEFFTKVSVLCGTSNNEKAWKIHWSKTNCLSINLVPASIEEVGETCSAIPAIFDFYVNPPRQLVDNPKLADNEQWYNREKIIARAPLYIEAIGGPCVVKAEGTKTIGQLLDRDYLINVAIPQQTRDFLDVLEVCNTAPYEVVDE